MEYKMSRRRWGIGLIAAGLAGALAVGGGELYDSGKPFRLDENFGVNEPISGSGNSKTGGLNRYGRYGIPSYGQTYGLTPGSKHILEEIKRNRKEMLEIIGYVENPVKGLEKAVSEYEKNPDKGKVPEVSPSLEGYGLREMLSVFEQIDRDNKKEIKRIKFESERVAFFKRIYEQKIFGMLQDDIMVKEYAVEMLKDAGVSLDSQVVANVDMKDSRFYQFFREDIEKDAAKTKGGEICLAYAQKFSQGVVDKHMKKSQNPKQDSVRAKALVDLLVMTAVLKRGYALLEFKTDVYSHGRIERYLGGETSVDNEAAVLADAAMAHFNENPAKAFNYLMDTPYSQVDEKILAIIEDNRTKFREIREARAFIRLVESNDLVRRISDLRKRNQQLIERVDKIRGIGSNVISN